MWYRQGLGKLKTRLLKTPKPEGTVDISWVPQREGMITFAIDMIIKNKKKGDFSQNPPIHLVV
jgi:hypothetical protein